MATSKYSKLFSPLQLRNGNSLINRAIMGSMHTGLEEGSGFWHGLDKMAGFFEERARGHVGLIVTGGIAPNSAGRVAPTAASMTTPSDAQRHRVVTDAVHGIKGTEKVLQRSHEVVLVGLQNRPELNDTEYSHTSYGVASFV